MIKTSFLHQCLISLLPILQLSFFRSGFWPHQRLRPGLCQPGQRHRSLVRRHHERIRTITERVCRLCPVWRWPRQGRASGRPATPYLLVFLHRRWQCAPFQQEILFRFGGFFSHTSAPTKKCVIWIWEAVAADSHTPPDTPRHARLFSQEVDQG